MAETLLSFGVEKLWELLVRESERFKGIEEQFNGLKRDVDMLRCFLQDADAKKHTSAMVRNTVKEIKEIVLDAEDIVETFLLKEDLGKTSGIRKRVKRLARVTVDRRELASDIRAITKRISKVIRDMQSLGVQQVIVNEKYIQSLQEIQREVRQTFSSDNEDHLVGLEKNVEILVSFLVEENSKSQVVSVTGMGGIGKTTLARQVFKHETIKGHFARLVWVCVSQQFTWKCVWQTILRQLRPDYKVLEMSEDELQEKLVRVLETQKALIVIDDIWREGDWDRIKPVFLPKKGWKVLLTSRNQGVALHADRQCITFKPECLTFEESWDLFQRIVFPRNDTIENKVEDEMEEMGKKMIRHCGGLPLAVNVLGGLLAPQYTLNDWKRVYDNIGSRIIGGTSFNDRNISSVYNILYLSFEELPIYLKYCFLYLAHFPEDHQINVEKLCCYWAAEGIPRPMYYDGASIRDVGDGYIEELVKRNMVISERDGMTSKYETCQLHDMMREVCLLKAEAENFVQIFDASTRQLQARTLSASSQLPCKYRRLVIHTRDPTFRIENPKLRSLLKVERSSSVASSYLCFTRLQLMRVLDLSFVEFKGGKFPSSIGKLIHLRYLSLHYTSVTPLPSFMRNRNVIHLPSSMQNLKQLIYLNICVSFDFKLSIMSNFFEGMRELTYLYLPMRLHDKVKIKLGNLVKLETLLNFSTKHGRVSDLQGMTRLETLSILFSGGCSVETLSSSLSELKRLENFTITDKRDETRTGEFELDCAHLRHLKLEIYTPRLPDEKHLPSHLTTLSLGNCFLEEDPMPVLGKLHHLKVVKLSYRSFCGRRMVCSRGGFPQLQELQFHTVELEEWLVEECSMPLLHKLQIEDCEKLEEWIVEEGSMPLLHTLDIVKCDKLKEFPDGLQFITSLKDLSVQLKGEKWKNRFFKGYLPSRLTTISLVNCLFEEDPMPILEKLLHLKKVMLSWRSFCGRRMVCSRSGFPQLQDLHFHSLEEWEEWIVEEGSMPLLHTLRIDCCDKFKELPDGLRFLTSLKDMSFYRMREDWKKKMSEGGEEFYKVQHIPSIECNAKQLRTTRCLPISPVEA